MVLDRHSGCVLGLLLLTAVVYAPARNAGWVHEDVAPTVMSRGVLTEVRAVDLPTPRSLTALSLRVQGGSTARAYHVGNLLTHLTNGLLLSLVLPATPVALVALGAFLLHPIQSEAVGYVSARADLLWGTAILVTLIASRARGVAGLALMALGLLACWGAKETGIMAIGLLALWLWQGDHRHVGPFALLCAAACAGGLLGRTFLSGLATWTAPAAETWRFLALQSAAIWRLCALVAWPVGFTPVHDWHAVPQVVGLLAFLGLIAVGVTAWGERCAWPRASFAVLWLLIALAPRLCVPTPNLLTEHHLYVPLLGLWLSAGRAIHA